MIQSPPYELEQIDLELEQIDLEWYRRIDLSVYADVVDAILWCCRPQSLTLGLNLPNRFDDWIRIVKVTITCIFFDDIFITLYFCFVAVLK